MRERGEERERAGAGPAGGQPGLLSPREAAFTVGLLNRSGIGRLTPGTGAVALARAVLLAEPADCLDAAFSGLGTAPAGDVHARIRGRLASAVPLDDESYHRGLARWLGVRFLHDVAHLPVRHAAADEAALAAHPFAVPVAGADGPAWILAPDPAWLPALAALTCLRPDLAAHLAVATPAALALAHPGRFPGPQAGRLEPLHAIDHKFVAERSVTPAQAVAASATAATFATLWLALPQVAAFSASSGLNAALLGHAATRLAAARQGNAPEGRPGPAGADGDLPVYSILVPLFREAGTVPHLVRALSELDYPAERLDIQFLVEACDGDTLDALLEWNHLPGATITVVPEGVPRTKPRALNVGLKRARGELVTIFDAEDRPEPDQLRKAAEAFREAPDDLGALQAHLVIDHADDSWITRMFAIEYACLFDGILPMMADRGWFFLLGGTSNHFRRDVLVKVGGWDPYNVTEDADLAVRLARSGYRLGQLSSATYEEAPLTMGAWVKQRNRWFKGWLQTWLVHNRNPVRLAREMGVRDALLFHVLVLGAFLAVLAHPFFCSILVLYAAGVLSLTPAATVPAAVLFALNTLVFVVGYGATFWLGAIAMRRRGLAVPRWSVTTLPFYWFLMAWALALAVVDLAFRPHYWAKTSHGLARRPFRGAPRST